MIEFNKLLVLPYNKGIYLDASIMDLPYFENVYLDYITIVAHDQYIPNKISESPAFKLKIEGNHKNYKLTIKDCELLVPTIEGTMFFVYVSAKGLPTPDTPCGLDDITSLAVCVDSYGIYRRGLQYIHEVYNTCNIPRHFIDFILRYKAFELCLKTRDFPLAITYWKGFWRTFNKPEKSNCSCYG